MIKEIIEKYCTNVSPNSTWSAEHISYMLTELFSQNIVIPKGKNRHPYADVLHEMAERPKNVIIEYTVDGGVVINTEYHIKPSEPVYEWQWLVKEFDDMQWYVVGHGRYYTEQEIGNWCGKKPIEETKRERKQ